MSEAKPNIVITEFMDTGTVEQLHARYSVHYDPDLADKDEAINPLLADAHAPIVRNRPRVDVSLLAQAPKLSVIGRLGVGLDNIDLAALR